MPPGPGKAPTAAACQQAPASPWPRNHHVRAGPGQGAGLPARRYPSALNPVQPMATPRRPPPVRTHGDHHPGGARQHSPGTRLTRAGRNSLSRHLDEAPLPARGEPEAWDRRYGPRSHRRPPCLVERDLRAPDVVAAFCLDELPAKRSCGPPPQASSVCLTRPRYHHPLMPMRGRRVARAIAGERKLS